MLHDFDARGMAEHRGGVSALRLVVPGLILSTLENFSYLDFDHKALELLIAKKMYFDCSNSIKKIIHQIKPASVRFSPFQIFHE